MPASIEQLQNEYYAVAPLAERFNASLRHELEELLKSNKISLGVPIEFRVKKLDSIVEKIERKTLSLQSVTDLPDLVGLRLILLFSRDVVKTCELISDTFNVLQKEDTQERLSESQFGYQSFHYVIQLPERWLSVPSFASLGNFKAEIQIRTVAQHMWAAASHVLQYKQESNVPLPVRRSIYRVSAILETVDLEFERVLDARASYISGIGSAQPKEPLNVDLLAAILDTLLPKANKWEADPEPYSELLPELLEFGIDSADELKKLIQERLKSALERDSVLVAEYKSKKDGQDSSHMNARVANGVFFTHVGLVRAMMKEKFGEKYSQYLKERREKGGYSQTEELVRIRTTSDKPAKKRRPAKDEPKTSDKTKN